MTILDNTPFKFIKNYWNRIAFGFIGTLLIIKIPLNNRNKCDTVTKIKVTNKPVTKEEWNINLKWFKKLAFGPLGVFF